MRRVRRRTRYATRSVEIGDVIRSHINAAGNRIVDATPQEIHALRPAIVAALRRYGCPIHEVEDRAQDVEILVWQAVIEGRVWCDRLTSAKSALISFTFQAAWYVWKNYSRRHSTWREILTDDPPELATSCTEARLEARDTFRRIGEQPTLAEILLLSLNGSRSEERANMARTTFWSRVIVARKWAREVDAGHWQPPRQPVPMTPRKRKKNR